MGKRFGNDRRLWVADPATPAVYGEIKGQQDLGQDATAGTIDTSDKNSAPYGTTAPGLIAMSISFEIYPDLPDPWFLVLQAAFLGQYPIPSQIRAKGSAGASPADVEFECSVYVLGWSKTRPKNGVVGVRGTLGLAGVPTTDTLL